MGRSPCCDNDAGMKKGPWTWEEDKLLVDYVRKHGQGSWRSFPRLAGLNRCGKSCRLRWINYLCPDTKRARFTDDEEKLIIHLHSIHGNKWSSIAMKVPGKTDNDIKIHWFTHLRKKLLSMGIDPIMHSQHNDLSLPAGLPNLLAAANMARGDSDAGASWDMKAQKLQADAAMFQLLRGHFWVSAPLGAMGALVGKLDMLLLAPPLGCSSKRVKDGIRLLKDDVEEISSYLDELSEVEEVKNKV